MSDGLGVDLGTTYSAAALSTPETTQMVTLGYAATVVPSAVFVSVAGETLVGEPALRRGAMEPDRLSREFKRRIGDSVPLLIGGSPFSAEALSARLLAWIVRTVVEQRGGPPDRLALTYPANWGPFKRERLAQTIRLADLAACGITSEVLTLTEPEAAAMSYAATERVPPGTVVAVYDLGGGTFDGAVLRKTDSGFDVLGSPEGIERLGGVDVDEAVFQYVGRALDDTFDVLPVDDPATTRALARLRTECVEAKEALSSDTEVAIPVVLPDVQTEVRLTRAELEGMVRPVFDDTVAALRRAITSADLTPSDVDRVLLVGGSSRIPMVAELVTDALDRPVFVDTHPKHAVALGAALYARTATLPAAVPVAARVPVVAPAPVPADPASPAPMTAPPGPSPPPPVTAPPGTSAPVPAAAPTARQSSVPEAPVRPPMNGVDTAAAGAPRTTGSEGGPPGAEDPTLPRGATGAAAPPGQAALSGDAGDRPPLRTSSSGDGPPLRTISSPPGGMPAGTAFSPADAGRKGRRGRLLLVVGIVVVVAVVAALLLRSDGDDEPRGDRTSSGGPGTSVDGGEGDTSTTTAPLPAGPLVHEVGAPLPVAEFPDGIAPVDDGFLWVASTRGQQVSRINAATRAVDLTVPLDGEPLAVLQAEGAIWVSQRAADTVARLDPSTGGVVATIEAPGKPIDLDVGAGSIWVVGSEGDVTRIDPADNTSETVRSGIPALSAVVATDERVYLTYGENQVGILDPETNDFTEGWAVVGSDPDEAILTDTGLWVANRGEGRVSQLDPESGEELQRRPIGVEPTGLVASGDSLWVIDNANGTVVQLSMSTGEVLAEQSIGTAPLAVTLLDDVLWISLSEDDTVVPVTLSPPA